MTWYIINTETARMSNWVLLTHGRRPLKYIENHLVSNVQSEGNTTDLGEQNDNSNHLSCQTLKWQTPLTNKFLSSPIQIINHLSPSFCLPKMHDFHLVAASIQKRGFQTHNTCVPLDGVRHDRSAYPIKYTGSSQLGANFRFYGNHLGVNNGSWFVICMFVYGLFDCVIRASSCHLGNAAKINFINKTILPTTDGLVTNYICRFCMSIWLLPPKQLDAHGSSSWRRRRAVIWSLLP